MPAATSLITIAIYGQHVAGLAGQQVPRSRLDRDEGDGNIDYIVYVGTRTELWGDYRRLIRESVTAPAGRDRWCRRAAQSIAAALK